MNLQRAIEIAVDAHKMMLRTLHPIRLMMQMGTEDEKMALLHDVVEDHGDTWSMDRLSTKEGFSNSVMKGLRSVTKTLRKNKPPMMMFTFLLFEGLPRILSAVRLSLPISRTIWISPDSAETLPKRTWLASVSIKKHWIF